MEPNLTLITIASISGAVGIALLFVGALMAMLVALGQRHYISGIAIFLFFPYAYVYWCMHRESMNYAARLLFPGLLLFVFFLLLLWWEMHRLGVDFLDILSSTRPVH